MALGGTATAAVIVTDLVIWNKDTKNFLRKAKGLFFRRRKKKAGVND